jgi:hypothetical protein
MSDRMSAEIWIGGKLRRNLLPEFCAIIKTENVELDFGSGDFAPDTAEDLDDAREDRKGASVLRFCNNLAHWGEFPDLEAWLQRHGSPYTRRTSTSDCYDGALVEFRPGSKPVVLTTNANGSPIASIETVERTWYLLKEAQQLLDTSKNARPVLSQAIEALGSVLPPELPSLPAFEIIG